MVSISKKIKTLKKKMQVAIVSFGVFFASCFCFCSGITHESTSIEKTSNEIANYIAPNSKTGYLSIEVSPNSVENAKKMPNTYDEYLYWKYIFRHSNFSYFSSVNAGKKYDCRYNEIDHSENITFVCCGYNSNPEFEGFYKHEVYDIKLMFKGKNVINKGAINFFAISQTRADMLLEKRGEKRDSEGKYSILQYEKLLGTDTEISIDKNTSNFTISNVYFESGDFHNNLICNFGEYALSYINFPATVKLESTFIFNSYDFQNIHKIKRMRSYFDSENFSFSLCTYNLNNKKAILSDLLDYKQIFGKNLGNNVLSVFVLIIGFLLMLFSCIFAYQMDQIHDIKYLIFVICSFLLPYFLFYLINSFHKIIFLFSHFSLIAYMFFAVLCLSTLLLILFKRKGETIRKIL